MKKIFLVALMLGLAFSWSEAQSSDLKERITEVSAIINEQSPMLNEYSETLEKENTELDERIIVLKYHKGNKEVSDACQVVVDRVDNVYNAVENKLNDFQSRWFSQIPNLASIYTEYGKMLEATGGGKTDLDEFVRSLEEYLQLIENLKSDLIRTYTNLGTIKNAI